MRMFVIPLLSLFALLCCAHEFANQVSQALQQKNAPLAFELLHRAESINPNDTVMLLQMATTNYMTHQYTKAATYYERALNITPDNSNIRYNCAAAHTASGHFLKAISHLELIHAKNSNDHVQAALFKLYIRNRQWNEAYALQAPSLWWYDENISGKTVLLDLDKPGNGLGDGIQFIRYAQQVKQAGATVYVKAPVALHPLLQRCDYIDRLFSKQDSIPSCDKTYEICIASLLMCLKDRIAMRAPQSPYLTADPELIEYWNKQINPSQCNIGLCWKSNLVRDRFTGEIVQSPRSISLEELTPLADPRATFYSLHKEPKPIEAPFELTQFHDDFDGSHGRFMDTAALLMNMDCIITVDTSIAHLAGALGKPVWLLLSCESDYRWFTDLDYSPLYPHVTIFRQKEYSDWSEVVDQVRITLHEYLAKKESQ